MKLPVLASVLILVVIISVTIKRSDKEMAHALDDFYEKERRANSVRKKSLDDLPYVRIPESILSIHCDTDAAKESEDMLKFLSGQKIVNFTGISNTDLKLAYGTANISVLTEYDQNYTLLVRHLQKLADELLKEDRKEDAKAVLEFAVSTKTDVSATYRMLADIYAAEHHPEKIEALIEAAKELDTVLTPSIVRALEEKLK